MILNQLMFVIMIVEATICLILSLPFGNKMCQNVVQFLTKMSSGRTGTSSSSSFSYYFRTPFQVMFATIVFLFLSNVQMVWKYMKSDELLSDGLRIRLLVAQRDMYISGFALFLFMLLKLVYSSMETSLKLEASLNAMTRQAKGASDGFQVLLKEQTLLEDKYTKVKELVAANAADCSSTTTTGEGNGTKNGLETLLTENAKMKMECKDALAKEKEAVKQLENVKTQAGKQSEAYMKLMDDHADVQLLAAKSSSSSSTTSKSMKSKDDTQSVTDNKTNAMKALEEENKSLKEQLQDYDFMFTESKKKDS